MLVYIESDEFGCEYSFLRVEDIHQYIGRKVEFGKDDERFVSVIKSVTISLDNNKYYVFEFTVEHENEIIQITSKNKIKIYINAENDEE